MRYISMEGINEISVARGICSLKGEGPWKDMGPAGYQAYMTLGQALAGEDREAFLPERMVRPCQEHTDRVLIADESLAGMGVVKETAKPAADGLISNIPGMVLCVITADCVPVALLDPVKKAIGLVHSGWKGTAGLISVRALEMMRDNYGTDPADVIVSIGAHICGKCYEVGPELIPRFQDHYSMEDIHSFFIAKEIAEKTHKDKMPENKISKGTITEGKMSERNDKYLLNMSRAISCSLIREGIRESKIHISDRCTFEDPELNSYRRDRKEGLPFTGRNLSALVLLP